jgi:hypothetical protein
MGIMFALIAVCTAAYFLFRGNTNRGIETVRAHVFLSAIRHGRSIEEANQHTNYDVASGPTEVITEAMDRVKSHYNGKQLPMIAEAKRLGMSKPS